MRRSLRPAFIPQGFAWEGARYPQKSGAVSQPDEPHAPPNSDAPPTVLGPDAIVFDVASGTTQRADAWIAACMSAEDRTNDECGDALVNAIARGDVRVEDEGL